MNRFLKALNKDHVTALLALKTHEAYASKILADLVAVFHVTPKATRNGDLEIIIELRSGVQLEIDAKGVLLNFRVTPHSCEEFYQALGLSASPYNIELNGAKALARLQGGDEYNYRTRALRETALDQLKYACKKHGLDRSTKCDEMFLEAKNSPEFDIGLDLMRAGQDLTTPKMLKLIISMFLGLNIHTRLEAIETPVAKVRAVKAKADLALEQSNLKTGVA